MERSVPPFGPESQLLPAPDVGRYVPGHPRVPLDDTTLLWNLLEKEFCAADLDRIAPYLWCMTKQDSKNISALHRQRVKGRNIILTEDPKLHLVWIHDRIFLKPLPQYLSSYTFWRQHLLDDDDDPRRAHIRRAALGFLRSYYYLIQYESDLRIAQEPSLCLVPAAFNWEQFCAFTSNLANIPDDQVSPRYAYGEIRLTRLNSWAPLLIGKMDFQRAEYQYGAYFAGFYGPILFVTCVVSVILSGLQIVATVEQEDVRATETALWISVIAIVACSSLLFSMWSLLVFKIAKEWRFALLDRRRLGKERQGGSV
ncbi:hypothetical protein BKA56DRAFT_612797 [Ilyonectria sp. MPI-CAGE-AT-0026]|nr:hypothetical protein BKA56DRAFT_612797 [Ilyonectria sp. MPI-CAGE-AT-0026]